MSLFFEINLDAKLILPRDPFDVPLEVVSDDPTLLGPVDQVLIEPNDPINTESTRSTLGVFDNDQ